MLVYGGGSGCVPANTMGTGVGGQERVCIGCTCGARQRHGTGNFKEEKKKKRKRVTKTSLSHSLFIPYSYETSNKNKRHPKCKGKRKRNQISNTYSLSNKLCMYAIIDNCSRWWVGISIIDNCSRLWVGIGSTVREEIIGKACHDVRHVFVHTTLSYRCLTDSVT